MKASFSIALFALLAISIANSTLLRKEKQANDWQKVFGPSRSAKNPSSSQLAEFNKFYDMVNSKQKNSTHSI